MITVMLGTKEILLMCKLHKYLPQSDKQRYEI